MRWVKREGGISSLVVDLTPCLHAEVRAAAAGDQADLTRGVGSQLPALRGNPLEYALLAACHACRCLQAKVQPLAAAAAAVDAVEDPFGFTFAAAATPSKGSAPGNGNANGRARSSGSAAPHRATRYSGAGCGAGCCCTTCGPAGQMPWGAAGGAGAETAAAGPAPGGAAATAAAGSMLGSQPDASYMASIKLLQLAGVTLRQHSLSRAVVLPSGGAEVQMCRGQG